MNDPEANLKLSVDYSDEIKLLWRLDNGRDWRIYEKSPKSFFQNWEEL